MAKFFIFFLLFGFDNIGKYNKCYSQYLAH